jgi:hypothetical protein
MFLSDTQTYNIEPATLGLLRYRICVNSLYLLLRQQTCHLTHSLLLISLVAIPKCLSVSTIRVKPVRFDDLSTVVLLSYDAV